MALGLKVTLTSQPYLCSAHILTSHLLTLPGLTPALAQMLWIPAVTCWATTPHLPWAGTGWPF